MGQEALDKQQFGSATADCSMVRDNRRRTRRFVVLKQVRIPSFLLAALEWLCNRSGGACNPFPRWGMIRVRWDVIGR